LRLPAATSGPWCAPAADHPSLHVYPWWSGRGNAQICRVRRGAESVRLVALTRIKVVRAGIHLVLEDAMGGSTGCTADDEHAPTGNIDPDRINPVVGSFGGRSARPAPGSSPVPPTHHGRLHQVTVTPRQHYRACRHGNGSSQNFAATRRLAPCGPVSRASPSDGCRLWRHCACWLGVQRKCADTPSCAHAAVRTGTCAGQRAAFVQQ